jgi:hypothetical protein
MDPKKIKWIAIAKDGAHGQIAAIENTLQPESTQNNLNILWGNYAGGASLCQSPNNDKGMMNHTLFKASSFHYGSVLEPL